jgi:hypothetical protein
VVCTGLASVWASTTSAAGSVTVASSTSSSVGSADIRVNLIQYKRIKLDVRGLG